MQAPQVTWMGGENTYSEFGVLLGFDEQIREGIDLGFRPRCTGMSFSSRLTRRLKSPVRMKGAISMSVLSSRLRQLHCRCCSPTPAATRRPRYGLPPPRSGTPKLEIPNRARADFSPPDPDVVLGEWPRAGPPTPLTHPGPWLHSKASSWPWAKCTKLTFSPNTIFGCFYKLLNTGVVRTRVACRERAH